MAPSIASVGTLVTGTTATAATHDFSKPSGVVNGSLLVALYTVEHNGSGVQLTAPSGWAAPPDAPAFQAVANGTALYVWFKIVTDAGSEPSTYAMPAQNGRWIRGAIFRVIDHNESTPWDVGDGAVIASNTSVPSTSITTTVDDCLLIWGASSYDTSAWGTMPTGFTENVSYASGSNNTTTMATQILATAGTVTTGSIAAAAGNGKAAWLGAIKPAVVTPDLVPFDIVPMSQTAGRPHYAYDIADRGASDRVLYPPSSIEAGLEFDPEFLAVNDVAGDWLQAAVYADAPTTSGTSNPRSEGRETQPGSDSNFGWSPPDGNTHWQRFRAKVMDHPVVDNAGVSVGQVHSLADDIMMVRTRVRSDNSIDLVLREYDGTLEPPNSADVLTLVTDYQFGDPFDLLFVVHDGTGYVFFNDFTVPVWTTDVSNWPVTGTYMFKWGCYNQFRDGQAGIADDDLGVVWFQNVQHHHTGWDTPTNYFGCPEVDLGASAAAEAGVEFNRTMSATGSGITEHKWTILTGPIGAGTTIGTAAALAWTPTAPGDYILMGGAKNGEGWSDPTFLSVTVSPSSGGGGGVRYRLPGYGSGFLAYTIALGAGENQPQVGDRVFVSVTNDHAHTTSTPSTGWTDHGEAHQGGTTNHSMAVYSRVLDGTGDDDLVVTLTDSGGHTALDVAVNVVCMKGDGGTPLVTFNSASTTPVTVASHGSLDSGVAYDSIIFFGVDNSSGVTQTVDLTDTNGADPEEDPDDWTNLTTTGTSANLIWGYSADREGITGVTSIAPGNIGLSTAEQWISAHVVIPQALVVETPVEVTASPVDITWTPQAVTADRNIVGHPDVVTITVTPQATDNAKFVDVPAAVDITVTGQAIDPAKATDVDAAVDITVTPQTATFSVGTSADPVDVSVEVAEARAARIFDVDPIDITITADAFKAARGLKTNNVEIRPVPLLAEYIVGNVATPIGTTVEVQEVEVGKIHDVDPVDITLTPEDADFARGAAADLVNISIMRFRTLGYTMDSGPIETTVTPQPIEQARAAAPLVIGVQVEVNAVDAAHIVEVTPVDITMAPAPASALTTDTDALNVTIEILPAEVAFSAEATPSADGIKQLPKPQPTRVIAQSILTKEFLHWDLAVHNLTIEPTLSGATEITGKFPVEIKDYRDLGLEPWGTWIHIEEDGQIRASGILQPTSISQEEQLSFYALGVSAYAHGIPYLDEYSEIGVDPAQIVKDLWAHMQQYPDADLGVEITGQTTVRFGTEEDPENKSTSGPYELMWWNGTDIGKEINTLAKETPFDFIERSEWNADKTEVLHFIDIGFPRVGTRRYELVFRQDENLLAAIGPEEPDDLFASQVLVLGSGEGRDTIRGYAGRVFGGRVRRVAVLDDKTVQNVNRAHSLAHLDLERRQALYDVEEITVNARHINAPFGSFLVGDDILVEAEVPWIGRVRQWERIISFVYSPDTEEVRIRLRRSESFIYGSGETEEEA